MKYSLVIITFFFTLVSHGSPLLSPPSSIDGLKKYEFGQLPMVQGATSETATTFNVLTPRLKADEVAAVVVRRNVELPKKYEDLATGFVEATHVSKFLTDKKGLSHWGIKKFFFNNLEKNTDYKLAIYSKGRYGGKMDEREFSTLDLSGNTLRFVLGSCMTDAFSFKHIRENIWSQIPQTNPDIIVLSGDIVYVDTFDFVEREKASEFDIWHRFIGAMRAIPFFSARRLYPLVATWDDHDMVTNNSDKRTKKKRQAKRAFKAFFGSENIPGVYENGHDGVYSSYQLRGQRLFLMDGRYFRERIVVEKDGSIGNKDRRRNLRPKLSRFAHWGQRQHQWMIDQLDAERAVPSWVVNGDQVFGDVILSPRKDYVKRINESLKSDHHNHFVQLTHDIKMRPHSPVAFASGDIHFSEIMRLDSAFVGYETYEFTSSPMHSYMFHGPLWDNPKRIEGVRAHNFMVIDSTAKSKKEFSIDVRSVDAGGNTLFSRQGLVIKTN